MQYGELIDFLQNVGKDPSRLIFEDELTGLHNRRFLLSYFEHKVHWDQDDHFPLSLLIVDVDLFKSINDTYGHDVGDAALVFVAGLLKEVAGDESFPVRFGGDEFMILLPRTELAGAVQHAHRLHQLTKERALPLPNGKGEIHISLSVGVASARTDASSGKDLIRKADTALYTSKKLGRNRVSVAREVDPEKTAPKTALHRLDDAAIAGRSAELAAVSEALAALSLGESRFLLIEGAPGMGKSTVVETIRRSLEGNQSLAAVKVAGRRQEGFRPYYLAGDIIVALMNQRPDKGVPALDALEPRELHYLGQVLPSFDDSSLNVTEDDKRRREGIFVTLVKLVRRLVDGRPLVLLIDDLHFADEGTLVMLRVLYHGADLPVAICGTVNETLALGQEEEAPPFARFLQSRSDLSVDKHQLRPLVADDIAQHLAGVFPGIDLPEGFESELARTTAGNPLFLGEILRKLVSDQKLMLVGQRWTVVPPEEGYLPRSLEEIVNQKIAALDAEDRNLLEQVSTMGEDVPLSVLTGASDVSENDVLRFLDRAEDLGLLRADFQINDETMRFLSKRVLEIVYGSIHQARRQELHELVGNYQEELHAKKLGPSASILAYHFKRSANQEKATRYEQLQIDLRRRTFDPDEAEHYTGEALIEADEEGPTDEKLAPEALQHLPNLFRTLVTTVRSVQLYPPDSKPIQKAYSTAFEAIDALLAVADHVALSRSQGVLLANGHKVDVADFRLLANSYLELLDRAELEGIEFRRGLTRDEVKVVLTHLGHLKAETIDGSYWKSFAAEQRLERILLRQMRYSEVRRRSSRATAAGVQETELDGEDWSLIPKILRALLGASKNVKLYPLGSRQVGTAVEQLLQELSAILARRRVLTLARAEGALLVNGARATTSGFETLAENFVAFLAASELVSVTFLEALTKDELLVFIGALKDLPSDIESSFWPSLAKEKDLQGIAFNDRRYATSLVDSVLETVETDPDPEDGPETEELARLTDEPTEALIDALPTVGKDLLVKGEQKLVRKVIRRVFSDYSSQDVVVREKIVRACRTLLEALIQALQHQFAAVAVDELLRAFREEQDDHLLGELANLLYQMTGSILQFADFTLASRIFAELRDRQRELMKTPKATGRGFAVLSRKMDASARSLLMEELQSKDPERQEKAALVLESLGKPAISLLIEVIKQEKDFRTRQLAAGLLSKLGRDAAERIKQEVVLEVTAEQRFRILEVIEVVTRDLKTELAFCLSDVNPKVRRAAFRLSERLNDKQVLELLVDFARHQDIGVAKGAIRSLASLRSPHAVGALVSTLEVTKDPERAIACAQALAQLGDAVAVPALEGVLTARKFPILGGNRWDDQVRATAAFALAHIGGDRAKAALKKVAEDADPRIRQIALHGASGAPRSAKFLEESEQLDSSDEDEGVA